MVRLVVIFAVVSGVSGVIIYQNIVDTVLMTGIGAILGVVIALFVAPTWRG